MGSPRVLGSPATRVPAETLEEALRTGPFDRALKLAIQASGLSLDRVHARLRDRGHRVSLASLSYWQRGRCRPERASSLEAVRALEEVLALRPDALIRLLGPRRPRGRWVSQVPGALSFSQICPVRIEDLLDQIQNPVDGKLTWLGMDERFVVGPGREERTITARLVFQARADGVDRYVAVHHSDRGRPDIRRTWRCRVGRVRTDPESGATAVELLFPRPLATGETCVIEYEFGYTGDGPPVEEYHRGFRFPARAYLLQVTFEPAAPPVRCYRTWRPDVRTAWQDVAELQPDGWRSVHLVELDVRPGLYGIRWEWD